MARAALYALLAVKAVLLVWGTLGLWEFLDSSRGFGLQNPGFPSGTQLLHWLLLQLTGALFLVGFATRWPYTVAATITMYATLATLCFIETVDFGAFGGGPERYLVMATEYLAYVLLSVYLMRSRHIGEHFGRPS